MEIIEIGKLVQMLLSLTTSVTGNKSHALEDYGFRADALLIKEKHSCLHCQGERF